MARLELTLETVSPMFCAGADNRTPELRAASFRGPMRFWLRALLGARYGMDREALARAEGALMGDTNAGSPVVVRTSARVPVAQRLKVGDRKPVPHSKRFTKKALAEGGRFKLILSSRVPQAALPGEVVAGLLLLVNLGGIGNRARRGFGSMQVAGATYNGWEPGEELVTILKPEIVDGDGLEAHLARAVAWAREAGPDPGDQSYLAGQTPGYPVLSEEQTKIMVCRHAFDGDNYLDAMVNLWDRLREQKYASREQAFGGIRPRRSSPLFVHLARSQAGCHLVFTAFRSKPEPMGAHGWALIDEFLAERADAWDGAYLLGEGVSW